MHRGNMSPLQFVHCRIAFRQSMLMSQGDMSIFFANGLVGSFTTLALLLLFWPLIARALAILRGRNGRP